MATGCSSTVQDNDRTLRVYAAASLQAPFEELAADFEEQHDGVTLQLVLTGSADAVAQIRAGAPAGVVATADPRTMGMLRDDDLLASRPRTFAANTLQLVADSDADIASTQDGWEAIAAGGALVVCAPAVPCGAATVALAERAGVELDPVSEEQSVTDVLAKVTSGAAELGIVYRTDALRAGTDVQSIELPGADAIVNEYPIAQVADTEQPDLAADFVALVLSDTGRERLDAAGFGTP